MTAQGYPTTRVDATDAERLQLALPLPSQELLALPIRDFATEATRIVASAPAAIEGLIQSQGIAEAAELALKRQAQAEDQSRKAAVLACVYARAIGAALPEPKRGRRAEGEESAYPVDPGTGEALITSSDARRYRNAAALPAEDFARWCQEAATVSFNSLALAGAAHRSIVAAAARELERDEAAAQAAATIKAAPTKEANSSSSSGDPPKEEELAGEDSTPAPPPGGPRLERYINAAERLRDDLSEEEDPRLAQACASTAGQLLIQLQSLAAAEPAAT